MSEKIHEFYFIIDDRKAGPFLSCPCVDRELAINFAFSKYFKQMESGNNKLSEKFSKRASLHNKIINNLYKNKTASLNPTCKFFITAERNIDLYKDMETSTSIVLNFDLIARLIPEKKENEALLVNARKNKDNYSELIKFNDQCTEEQSYIFLLAVFHASQLKLDIILPGMYYIELFELIVTVFNDCKYDNLEIYLLDVNDEYIDRMIKEKRPEFKFQDFMYKSYTNIFEMIINDKSLILSRKPKLFRADLSDFLKTKKAKQINIDIVEQELKKISGGGVRRKRINTRSFKIK